MANRASIRADILTARGFTPLWSACETLVRSGQYCFLLSSLEGAVTVHSDFYRMDRIYENIAEGCDPIRDEEGKILDWKYNIYSFPPIGSPDSGALVTVGDLDRFLRAVQAGKLISPELTEAFLTPQVKYRESDNWITMYGYGLMFYLDKSGRLICYQKDGINAGVSGIIRYYPDWDINITLLSNMESGVWEPIWKIHELVVNLQPG